MAARALLLLAAVVVSLLLGEALVRIAGAGDATLSRGALHSYAPDYGWTCRPNLDARYVLPGNFDARTVCNRHGQRSPELALARTPRHLRIAVLGDSFMWGYGVENDEVLPNRLPGLLPGAEVVNLGANGYGTVQELVRFEVEGVAYAPDWTVLAFTWNDLGDNFDDKGGGRPLALPQPDGRVEIGNRPVRRPWKDPRTQWLREHSRLFSFANYTSEFVRVWLRDWRRERSLHARAEGAAGARDPGVTPRWERRAADPMDFAPRELYGAPSSEVDVAWQTVQVLLGRIDALARGAGGRLLVVANANSETLRPEAFARRYGSDPALDRDQPARRLAGVCRELGVEFLDLNPLFRRDPEPESLFFPTNSHWSPRGHALAAEAVAERLRALSTAGG